MTAARAQAPPTSTDIDFLSQTRTTRWLVHDHSHDPHDPFLSLPDHPLLEVCLCLFPASRLQTTAVAPTLHRYPLQVSPAYSVGVPGSPLQVFQPQASVRPWMVSTTASPAFPTPFRAQACPPAPTRTSLPALLPDLPVLLLRANRSLLLPPNPCHLRRVGHHVITGSRRLDIRVCPPTPRSGRKPSRRGQRSHHRRRRPRARCGRA